MASTEGAKLSHKRRAVMVQAMFMNTLRGDHSTGFAAVALNHETKEPVIWKRAMAAPDFLALERTRKILADVDKMSILMTHNRAATQAPVNNTNAHPFQFGHITLTHNGHITNTYQLVDYARRTEIGVDSAHVAQAMELIGEKETLERVEGGYAFVWHNTKDGTLNFARNSQRPLRFCFIKGENTLFYMSEREMLVSILQRNELTIEGPFMMVPEKTWIKFDVKDLRNYTTIPFSQRPAGTARTPAGGTAGGNTTVWGSQGSHTKTHTVERTTTSRGGLVPNPAFVRGARVAGLHERLIANLLGSCKKPPVNIIEQREFALRKNSNRPTGNKKVRAAENRLATTGFQYDQMVVVDLIRWESYKNQTNRLGFCNGNIFSTEVPVHMSGLTLNQYSDFKNLSVVLARVVNLKPDKYSSSLVLMVEAHPLAEEFDAEWRKRWKDTKRNIPPTEDVAKAVAANIAARGAVPQIYSDVPKVINFPKTRRAAGENANGDSGDDSSKLLTHYGPNGTMVSAGKFSELSKVGCGYCSTDISQEADKSKKIFWIDSTPICESCQQDPKASETLNLPQRGMLH